MICRDSVAIVPLWPSVSECSWLHITARQALLVLVGDLEMTASSPPRTKRVLMYASILIACSHFTWIGFPESEETFGTTHLP